MNDFFDNLFDDTSENAAPPHTLGDGFVRLTNGAAALSLRPYQEDCQGAVIDGLKSFRSQLAVIPTGGGKTVIFAGLAKALLPKRTLILAHREELIEQAVDKIHKFTGIHAEVEKADRFAGRKSSVVVASVQTLQGERLRSWSPDHFGLVVADEAHHALAQSWQNPLNHFTGAKILGVTATPHRGDKKNLGSFFESIAYEVGLMELVSQGYLAEPMVQTVPVGIDMSKVGSRSGDYDEADLAAAITPHLTEVMNQVKMHASDRKLLFFLPLIATSKLACQLANDMGIKSVHVDGEDPDRKAKLAAYARGEYQALFNAMLLLEGYDEPSIDCVVMLRPTRSQALYAQAIGRGTRLYPGKKDLLILDFLWLHEKHALCRPASLIAKTDTEVKAIVEMCSKGGKVSLREVSNEARQQREQALMREIKANAKKKASTFSLAEIAAIIRDPELTDYEPVMNWQKCSPSIKQAEILAKLGVPLSEVGNSGLASNLISKLIDRGQEGMASLKQIKMLQRWGHPAPYTATKDEAGAFIGSRLGHFKSRR